MSALPDPIHLVKRADAESNEWAEQTNPFKMEPGVEYEFLCVEPSEITRKTWDSTAEQELVRIQEVYDTASGALFVADDANLFEDSAGNVAASVNGVMGCWLSDDGISYGTEVLTNGDFEAGAASWVVANADATHTVTFSGGAMRYQSAGVTPTLSVTQAGVLISGGAYRVDISITAVASGSVKLAGLSGYVLPGTPGDYSFYLIASDTYVSVQRNTENVDITLGGISIRPVYGAAIQSTTANKPYLRRTPTTGLNWADSNTATAALNVTFASALGSACTVVRVGPDGVTFTENVTIGTTYNIAPAYGWNGDVAIIDRPLTATEKALFTRYMLRHKPGLGAEFVVNGTFDTDINGWTLGSGATNNDGVGVLDATSGLASNTIASSVINIPAGKTIYTSYSIPSVLTATTVRVLPGASVYIGVSVGAFSKAGVLASPSTICQISVNDANKRLAIDNVSVKEII